MGIGGPGKVLHVTGSCVFRRFVAAQEEQGLCQRPRREPNLIDNLVIAETYRRLDSINSGKVRHIGAPYRHPTKKVSARRARRRAPGFSAAKPSRAVFMLALIGSAFYRPLSAGDLKQPLAVGLHRLAGRVGAKTRISEGCRNLGVPQGLFDSVQVDGVLG